MRRVMAWGAVGMVSVGVAAAVGVTRSGPPHPPWPDEPAGFREVSDQPWNAVRVDGWTPMWGPTPLGNDPTAPESPPSVLDITYPVGFPGGSAPGTVAHPLPRAREVFVGLWWKPSDPWQGHESNVNKIAFLFPRAGGDITLVMYGSPGGPYELRVIPQFQGIDSDWLRPNLDAGIVTLGRWHRVEWLVTWSSAPGVADGTVRWWLDGRLVGAYDRVPFPDGAFGEFKLSPTWGGIGDAKRQEDHFWFDQVRLSAR